MTRPASVVINLAALKSNFQRIRQLVSTQRIMAIVKADAYGHGITRVARSLDQADAFGVACLEEAQELRAAGISQPIVLLEGPFHADELSLIQQLDLEIVVHHADQFAMLDTADGKTEIRAWLKIDTGMHRLGFAPADVSAARERLLGCKTISRDIRLMTHLASANDPDAALTARQLETFYNCTRGLADECSIANSAAILDWPDSHADWVRPGLLLYGVSPSSHRKAVDEGLQPVMTLRSRLISVKSLQAGESIGYGATWICPEAMPIGIVAAGYGDGYPRHARSGTPVLVNNRRAGLIGLASMDMLAVDLRRVPEARVGDPVVLWGDGLPVEEIAGCADTIPYELLCGDRKRMTLHEQG